MLVPNPQDDFRARIGDTDVDATSELSECPSVASLDSLSITSSSDGEDGQSNSPVVEARPNGSLSRGTVEAKNLEIDGSLLCEFGQQDSEYTEDYASVDQRRLTSLTPHPETPPPRSRTPTPRPRSRATPSPLPHREPPVYRPLSQRMVVSQQLQFTVTPQPCSIHSGRTARFMAQLHSAVPSFVTWYHNGKPVSKYDEPERFCCYSEHESHHMDIYWTTPKDSGTYSCVAYTDSLNGPSLEAWCDTNLTVRASRRAPQAPEFPVEPPDAFVEEGDKVKISWQISGHPEPLVSFILPGNKQLFIGSKDTMWSVEFQGGGVWMLSCKQATENQSGVYIAMANSPLGSVISKVKLNVSPRISSVEVVQSENVQKISQLNSGVAVAQAITKQLKESVQKSAQKVEKVNGAVNEIVTAQPPKPGTIAEREHNKWLSPVPMPNNPYSAENLARRAGRRNVPTVAASQIKLPDFPELPPENVDDLLPQKHINLEKYKRDYYVPKELEVASLDRHHSRNISSDVEHEVKSHPSSRKVTQEAPGRLEGKVPPLVRQESLVEREVARLQHEIDQTEQSWLESLDRCRAKESRRRSPPRSQSTPPCAHRDFLDGRTQDHLAGGSESDASLPSVKELARQFLASSSDITLTSVNSKVKDQSGVQEKPVVIVEKAAPTRHHISVEQHVQERPPVREVHSLTARNMSRDIRSVSQRQALPSFSQPVRPSPDKENGNPCCSQTKIDLVQVISPPLQKHSSCVRLEVVPQNTDKTVLPSPVDTPTVLLPFATSVCPLEDVVKNTPINSNGSVPFAPQRQRDTPSPEHLGIPLGKVTFPPLRGPEPPEYTSDESGGAGNSDPPIVRRVPPRRKNANKSIVARAAYWDRRAERGLLSDSCVEDEFPPMQV